jgi:leucyl-tRNA synthetase
MTSERYNARETEPRWQRQWDEKAIFASRNDDPRPKYYVLEMFPYPVRADPYRACPQLHARRRHRALYAGQGHNVLHPMGWDAFGLPAENAAIERKVAPKAWTYDNIAAMKKQLQSIGLSLDWSRDSRPAILLLQASAKLFNDFLRAGWPSARSARSTGIRST